MGEIVEIEQAIVSFEGIDYGSSLGGEGGRELLLDEELSVSVTGA